MGRYHILLILIFVLVSGCITARNDLSNTSIEAVPHDAALPLMTTSARPAVPPQKTDTSASSSEENYSIAVEVNYRQYVDWFMNHNLYIRAYTPQEYVCGQYTVDMINDSAKAGYKAYFAAVKFSDGTGHALVSFKSTVFGFTSWYFFEPQTNNLMTPETLDSDLDKSLGKTVTEVTVYGHFDDAGDKDPSTWRFSYPLYNKKYR